MLNIKEIFTRLVPACEAIVRGDVRKVGIGKDINAYKIPGKGGYVLRIDIKVREGE